MKKKRKKLKKKVKFLIRLLLIIVIILIISFTWLKKVNDQKKYEETYEYKLLSKGYSNKDINIILNKLENNEIDSLLNIEYKDLIPKLINEKYFLFKNLDRYILYYEDNKKDLNEVVSMVNVNRDYDYYENTKPANLTNIDTMLVNKYYYLDKDYIASELTNISLSYSYAGNSATKKIIDAFLSMYNDAKKDNIQLIINSSYRSYEDQDEVWSTRRNAYGTKNADAYAARAGYSEHQTGLALDIGQYNYEGDDEAVPAYEWLANNSYKYGFILRYPEGKEEITGYSYEPWHFRYLGIDLATKVYNEGITYDEYYAYYIEE